MVGSHYGHGLDKYISLGRNLKASVMHRKKLVGIQILISRSLGKYKNGRSGLYHFDGVEYDLKTLFGIASVKEETAEKDHPYIYKRNLHC